MTDKAILRELGFTEGEIKVYYALFELGETTVGPISKASGVTHAKVYPILDKLIEKGLVSHVIRDGRKHFSATNPCSIVEYINSKVRQLEEEKEKVEHIIPSLLAKQKEKEQAQYSRVFEGFKGLKSLFTELFTANKEPSEICVFGLNEHLKSEGFISFFRFYHPLRIKSSIKLKLILNKDMEKFVKDAYAPFGNFINAEARFVDIAFPVGVFIFKDHVINIVAEDKVTAFDIKSGQMAERFRKFFYSVWERN